MRRCDAQRFCYLKETGSLPYKRSAGLCVRQWIFLNERYVKMRYHI